MDVRMEHLRIVAGDINEVFSLRTERTPSGFMAELRAQEGIPEVFSDRRSDIALPTRAFGSKPERATHKLLRDLSQGILSLPWSSQFGQVEQVVRLPNLSEL